MLGARDTDKSGGHGKGTVAGGIGRFTLAALLIWLLILDLVLVIEAAKAFDKMINGFVSNPKAPPAGNTITPYVLLFALIDGGFVGAGILLGLSHVYLYNAGSVGPAFTAAVYSWGINLLTLGFVWKEMRLGKQGKPEKTIEVLVIIIGIFATIYTLILFAALHHPSIGVGYHTSPV